MEEKHFIDDFLYEFESKDPMEKHASCSILEFKNLFARTMFDYSSIITFLKCLGKQYPITDLEEKLLFLIDFEKKENIRDLLHICLDRSSSFNTFYFLLKNGFSVNGVDGKGRTLLTKSMFIEKIDSYGEFYLDLTNQIPLFTLILQRGGVFGLRGLSNSEKDKVIRSLKEREDLVTILKENEFQFTAAQKQEWNDIRLHFIC